jgi:hypothetical protein
MTDRAKLEQAVRDAELELEAARKPTEVKAAAQKLQLSKTSRSASSVHIAPPSLRLVERRVRS